MNNGETIQELVKRRVKSLSMSGVVRAYRVNPESGTGKYILQERRYRSVDERKKVMKQMLSLWGGTVAYFQISINTPCKNVKTPVLPRR